MAIHEHEYHASVVWSGGRDGKGTVTSPISGASLPIAVPTEFQGPGGGTNPEELLTNAIAACYTITFGIVATNRKLPIQDLRVSAVGVVEQNGAAFTYTRISIRPHITLAADATPEQRTMAKDLAHKADNYCIITNAVRGKVEVVVEETID